MIRAAGLMLMTGRDGKVLFVRRRDTGLWAFPGGHIEEGETALQAAEREAREEIGPAPYSNPKLLMRRIKADGGEEVDFTTFAASANEEFIPALNEEHTGWMWANIDAPPSPLHPGAAVALAKIGADELEIARLMAAGDLVSPQRYGTFWLWTIRITGTGAAYRDSRNEWCWRPARLYLNDDFLARCNGLPVIFVHPEKKPQLDSQEFSDRTVGTVFLPFLCGEEVWAVVKIYDTATVDVLLNKEFSTSPAVVFGESSGGQTLKTEDGTALLIEGKPALLDHIALVPAGVWDKGGPPSGVSTTLTEEPIGMTEEEKAAADKARQDAEEKLHAKLDAIADSLGRAHSRMDAMEEDDKKREEERKDRARSDAARKDHFGPRKDGEGHKDWAKRHDADEIAMCDALRKDGAEEEKASEDARRARKDAEDREAKEGGETFAQWAKEEDDEDAHRDDKTRKDAGEKEERERKEREEKERMDAQHRHDAQTIGDLKKGLEEAQAAIKRMSTAVSSEDRNALAQAQSRADGVMGLFGKRASPPIAGEHPLEYRRRLAAELKSHSPKFKSKNLAGFDADVLEMAEEQIYADAAAAARSPGRAGAGMLIPIREQDEAGRTITRWTGDNMAWMQYFMSPGRVGRILDPRNRNGA